MKRVHSPLNRGGCGLDANLAPPFQHSLASSSTCAKARLYSAQAPTVECHQAGWRSPLSTTVSTKLVSSSDTLETLCFQSYVLFEQYFKVLNKCVDRKFEITCTFTQYLRVMLLEATSHYFFYPLLPLILR